MEKLIGLTYVCLIIVSLVIMIPAPAHTSPVSTSPFMKADTDQVEDGLLSSGDDTFPPLRAPWLPAGSELLILEVPLSEPPGSNRETDSTGVLLMYDE